MMPASTPREEVAAFGASTFCSVWLRRASGTICAQGCVRGHGMGNLAVACAGAARGAEPQAPQTGARRTSLYRVRACNSVAPVMDDGLRYASIDGNACTRTALLGRATGAGAGLAAVCPSTAARCAQGRVCIIAQCRLNTLYSIDCQAETEVMLLGDRLGSGAHVLWSIRAEQTNSDRIPPTRSPQSAPGAQIPAHPAAQRAIPARVAPATPSPASQCR